MTRDEYRAKCIKAMEDAYWLAYGNNTLRDCLVAALDALPTAAMRMEEMEEMIEIGAKALAEYQTHLSWDIIGGDLKNAHRREVSAILEAVFAGDLTNPPETKP